jgi:protein gp37
MAEVTGISWAHATQNYFLGCDKIDPLCAHCYIGRVLSRMGREPWGELYKTKTWAKPDIWQRNLAPTGTAWRVFTCSLSDFFHVKADEWRPAIWEQIKRTPNLVYLILTKRAERIEKCLPADWPDAYPNVWPGVSAGCLQSLNKMDALRRIPIHPDAVRWISAEPLLEDISDEINFDGYSWCVTGGESGSGAEYLWNPKGDWRAEFKTDGRRSMRTEWAEKLRDKSKAAGLSFLFKQATAPRSGQGSNLLGRIWHEFPPPPTGLVWAERAHVEELHKWTPIQIAAYSGR